MAAAFSWAVLFLAPAFAEDRPPAAGTDRYDRPVLAVDPGMHSAAIWSQAVDREGRYAVTGGSDHTIRIWSLADGKLLQTIRIPVGPEPVGAIYAVAISPDASIVAAGGCAERISCTAAIYLFDRGSGMLTQRIPGGEADSVSHLASMRGSEATKQSRRRAAAANCIPWT